MFYKEMLIYVISFFCDEGSFDYFCFYIIFDIFSKKFFSDIVRVWVCGCVIGEEVYFIVICFYEYLVEFGDFVKIKIFVSDLFELVIVKVCVVIYFVVVVVKILECWFNIYFEEIEKGWWVKIFICDMCVFVVYNVLIYFLFVNLDLLSCRNVLIYMKLVL